MNAYTQFNSRGRMYSCIYHRFESMAISRGTPESGDWRNGGPPLKCKVMQGWG